MQIFSRRVNEGLVIGEELQVQVLDIGEDSVDLEIRSTQDGEDDVQLVTLRLPADKRAEELVGAGADATL